MIAKSTGIVMAGVLLSRVLGFFREWTVAHQMGANAATSAYYAAFTLPDFLNYLVAAGSLSVTFIPVFAKYVAEGKEEEGWHVFSTVVTFMGVAVTLLVIAGEIWAGKLVTAIVPGFDPAEKQRVVFLTRIMLPAQICFYEGSILSAVQYAKNQFVIPSLAPLIYNIGIILGGVLLASRIGMTGFAVGVLAGAIAGNFLLQIYGAVRAGSKYRPSLDLRHPGFKMFIKLAVPIMLALSLSFTDDWIIRWFGSYLQPAAITWLSYSKTLMRVPLGVVGQAVGVASFPVMATLYSEQKFTELNSLINSTLKALIFLLVPISALTIAESSPLVYLVFSHTRMTTVDLQATAATLSYFSIGMFAWGAQNILARGFYSTRNTMTPAIVGTLFTVLNLPMYWWLVRREAHLGLALASSLGIMFYTVVLYVLLNRRTSNQEAGATMLFFVKVCIVSGMAAAICFKLTKLLESLIAWHRITGALLVLTAVSSLGMVLIAILSKLFRIREVDGYLKRLWSLVPARGVSG
ncbi:MAG: murein biosynthesis integral membrane protein MurJ [Candidatus Acidiferrales bacterium]